MAIYRTNKLKGRAALTGIINEHSRAIRCHNADSSLKHLNDVLYGTSNHKADVDNLLDKVTAKTRKDAVLAFDFVLTVSPEWFKKNPVGSKGYEQWIQQSMKFLEASYGKENIAYAVVHLDESTPHIQGVIVPLDKKPDGSIGLNCKKFLDNGGRGNINGKLNKTQDLIGKYYQPLGISRGVKGSKATHKRIRVFYNEMAKLFPKNMKSLTIEDVQQSVLDVFGNKNAEAQKVFDQLLAAANTSKMRKITADNFREELIRLREENTQLKNEISESKKPSNVNRKEIDNRIRGMNLETIASDLGLVKSQKDGYWRDAEEVFKLDIKDSKFYDFKASKGNTGAFDLVSHINGWSFADSRDFLTTQYGFEETQFDFATKTHRDNIDKNKTEIDELQAQINQKNEAIKLEEKRMLHINSAVKKDNLDAVKSYSYENKSKIENIAKQSLKRFVPPPAVSQTWEKVRNYLVSKRKLSSEFIEKMKNNGVLYSDRRNNIVWKYEEGAILHGTAARQGAKRFKGFAPGSSRKDAWTYSTSNAATTAIICESPIDGISLAQMAQLDEFEIISTGGVSNEPPKRLKEKSYNNILIAYDSDPAGQKAAYSLEREISKIQPKATLSVNLPDRFKDWNEALQADLPPRAVENLLEGSQVRGNLNGTLNTTIHKTQGMGGL